VVVGCPPCTFAGPSLLVSVDLSTLLILSDQHVCRRYVSSRGKHISFRSYVQPPLPAPIPGTGQGGESIWGGYIKDEFHPKLKHDERGVVSWYASVGFQGSCPWAAFLFIQSDLAVTVFRIPRAQTLSGMFHAAFHPQG
jgi:hypothetical protein